MEQIKNDSFFENDRIKQIKAIVSANTVEYNRLKESLSTSIAVTHKMLSNIDFSSIMMPIEALQQARESWIEISGMLTFKIGPKLKETITEIRQMSMELTESVKRLAAIGAKGFNTLQTPSLDWIRSLDFSPIIEALRSLRIDPEVIKAFQEHINEVYLRAMYESKWVPFCRVDKDRKLLFDILSIISTSKGASKRREKRIDSAIIGYYSNTMIRAIRKDWSHSDIEPSIRKALIQSIDAFLRNEYALTVSCLATMWEGLICLKATSKGVIERKRQRPDITKQELQSLIAANGLQPVLDDYFNNFIVSQCDRAADMIPGVPNRHGVAHGWYSHYPNKKAALNAILFTDFILNLEPLICEEV